MSRADPRAVLSQLHRLAAEDLPDRELLERFRGGRDPGAFAALVRRHGPLGCAAGTLKSRLGRARQLLGRRLARRGVALPAGAAAVLLATGAGNAATLPTAARVAAAFTLHETPGASAAALRLAHQLTRAMT